ncbi:MAG: hypothetical protein M1827_004568 [Pycnora praestabilis]|nr:MAG: hypothetical protein M1827_004568 [Pycnora praestabilis]
MTLWLRPSLSLLLLISLVASTKLSKRVVPPIPGVRSPNCDPPSEYGTPAYEGCVVAYVNMHIASNIRTYLRGGFVQEYEIEFLGLGSPRTKPELSSYQTPAFFTDSNCRIAILMQRAPAHDVARWTDIALAVNRILRCPKRSGYMFKGAKNQIGVYVYATDSQFSELVQEKMATWARDAERGGEGEGEGEGEGAGEDEGNAPQLPDPEDDDDGPSSSKRPKIAPKYDIQFYCTGTQCGNGFACIPVDLNTKSQLVLVGSTVFSKTMTPSVSTIGLNVAIFIETK